MSVSGNDWTERTVTLGATGSLIGIYCAPGGNPRSKLTAVFLNSGLLHRVGPNRLYVRIARELARVGIGSLRFDLSGIGDSATSPLEADSILGQVQRDVVSAIDFAVANGANAVVLLGICSGADNAFHTATLDERVAGVVLIDPNAYRTTSFYLHHIRKRMLRGRTWLNLMAGPHSIPRRLAALRKRREPAAAGAASVFLAPTTLPPIEEARQRLTALIARQTRMLYIFTGGLEWRYNHKRQLFRAFPGLDWKGCAELEYYGDSDHTFSRVEHQRLMIHRICAWAQSTQFQETIPGGKAEEVLVF